MKYAVQMTLTTVDFEKDIKSGVLKPYAKADSIYQFIDAQGDVWRLVEIGGGYVTLGRHARGNSGSWLDIPTPDKIH